MDSKVLRREPGIEVHMTREDDNFVPIWDRGEIATDVKGDRPGVFVSIHANSFPDRRAARGFETYFLSEARNEHERRVSAIENAPLSVQGEEIDPEAEPDLGFILRELRTLDHQHWSALFAELDKHVPAVENMAAARRAFAAAGNQAATVETLDGCNHLFQRCATGYPDEYFELDHDIAPEVLDRVSDWITGIFAQ